MARPVHVVDELPGEGNVPNLVIAKIGADGKVGVFNAAGATHVVVDVVGCFATDCRRPLHAADAGRLLDTRTGGCAPLGPGSTTAVIGPRAWAVCRRRGVSAVLLNVDREGAGRGDEHHGVPVGHGSADRWRTSTGACRGRRRRPQCSCKVGADGKVQLFNSAGVDRRRRRRGGLVHVVADGDRGRNVAGR